METIKLNITSLGGDTKMVDVRSCITIGDLKREIAAQFKTSPSCLRLSISDGQIIHLDKDQKTVGDYNLSSGCTVNLLISNSPRPFQVFVKNIDGVTKTYVVTEEETVSQLMIKIYHKEGIPVDQQRLIYSGKQLEAVKKLMDYNITSGSTSYLTLRLRGGILFTPVQIV